MTAYEPRKVVMPDGRTYVTANDFARAMHGGEEVKKTWLTGVYKRLKLGTLEGRKYYGRWFVLWE